jgi:hypothetical protein
VADDLDGKTLNSGAGSPPLGWAFTRAAGDTATNYTGAAIALVIYGTDSLKATAQPTESPVLTLSIGSGLTKTTNDPDLQEGTITFTAANLTTLRGAVQRAQFRYFWKVTPTGAADAFTAFVNETGGYDGVFFVQAPGWAGVDPGTVKA